MRFAGLALVLALVSCHPSTLVQPAKSEPSTPEAASDQSAPPRAPGAKPSEASAASDEADEADEADPDTVEDDPEDAGITEAGAETRPHPLDGLSDADLKRTVAEDP